MKHPLIACGIACTLLAIILTVITVADEGGASPTASDASPAGRKSSSSNNRSAPLHITGSTGEDRTGADNLPLPQPAFPGSSASRNSGLTATPSPHFLPAEATSALPENHIPSAVDGGLSHDRESHAISSASAGGPDTAFSPPSSGGPNPPILQSPAPLPQPAFSVEIPDSPHLTDEGQRELQKLAETWYEQAADLPDEPGTPSFDNGWIDSVKTADFLFRQRFGQYAWLQHHIQAHQLGSPK